MPALMGNPDHRCPWCGVLQVKMEFPQKIALYRYPCERCGKLIQVFVDAHTTWSIKLSKPDARQENP